MSCFKSKLLISSLFLLSVNAFSAEGEILGEQESKEPIEIGGRILFKGLITDSSCAIAQDNKEVDLKEHSIAELKKAGDKTTEEEFTISVIDCSLATASLKIKMEGTPHKDNNILYALDVDDKSAQNVGISVSVKDDGTQMIPGGAFQNIAMTKNSRDHSVTYLAGYQATGTATPGTGNATIHYTVSYE